MERDVPRAVAPTPALAAAFGARWIAARAEAAIAARGVFTVALAGGESPRPMHESLAARDDIAWPRWEFFLGDERAVPESDPRSNLRAARASLLSVVTIDPARVHPMFVEGRDLDALADDYAAKLPPVLDLIVLGLGKDAHTLSLHPGCAAIGETARAVVAVRDPPMDPAVSRLTLTPVAVSRARAVLLFAHGAGKAAAVRSVLAAPDDVMRYPAQIVRAAGGEVLALLDEAAASSLTT